MDDLLHDLIMSAADRCPENAGLRDGHRECCYGDLADATRRAAAGLSALGMDRFTRVGVLLPKSIEAVISFFATAAGGGIFVPINPLLKPRQVGHILRDSGAEILITSVGRLADLAAEIGDCPELKALVTVDDGPVETEPARCTRVAWADLANAAPARAGTAMAPVDEDAVAIFYTSGSTGQPKGVVLTHRNMVIGARSVASYLHNRPEDRLLAVLPFSFDYGFSQLTTAFYSGAQVVLLNYLLPADVLTAVQRERITGLAGVPPLWIQLAALEWPTAVNGHLRYITNSGGKLPVPTIRRLCAQLPKTDLYLMYGLTEAFRSTYLPPEQLHERPTSIGKAIPGAHVMVVRADGTECGADEPGELVHRGPLVARGYWCDEERTRERFRPAPGVPSGIPLPEIAVWSGDIVRKDADGYLYFVGRNDELIKTSGYRVSPTEVEEALYATHRVSAAVAFGVAHPTLGQSIVAVVEPAGGGSGDSGQLLEECRKVLPAFMVPATVIWADDLPRNPNGKLDRSGIIQRFRAPLEHGCDES